MSKLTKGNLNKKKSAEYENSAEAPTTNIGGLQRHVESKNNSSKLVNSMGLDDLSFSYYGNLKNDRKKELIEDLNDYISKVSCLNKKDLNIHCDDDLYLRSGYKIDWLSFTFSDKIPIDLVLNDLGYRFDEFSETSPRYFYNSGYTIGGYVSFYFNSLDKDIYENSSRTVNVVFTGQGSTDLWNRSGKCRKGLIESISKLRKYNVSCTRLDLAFDDFDGILKFDLMEHKLRKSEYRSSKRSYNIVKSSDVKGSALGQTIYIGSTRSSSQKGNYFVRFYDKKAQYIEKNQKLPGVVENSGIWKRAEISFTKKKSNQIFYDLINGVSEDYIFKTSMRNIVEFLSPTKEQKNAKIQRRDRWKVSSWWDKFLNYDNKYYFENHERDLTLSSLIRWLSVSVLPSLKLLEIIGDLKGFDIYEILRETNFDAYNFSKKQKRLLYDSLLDDSEDIKNFINEIFFGADYYG